MSKDKKLDLNTHKFDTSDYVQISSIKSGDLTFNRVEETKPEIGKKFDGAKPRMDLMPHEFNIGVSKAFTFGAEKYDAHNFKNGLEMSRLLAAAKRHIELELAGVKIDKESGLEHWMLAGASLAMYSFMKTHRPEMDDRYKYTEEELARIEEMMYGEKK